MVCSSIFPSVVCPESRAAEHSAEHFCQVLWVQPVSLGWRSGTLEANLEANLGILKLSLVFYSLEH